MFLNNTQLNSYVKIPKTDAFIYKELIEKRKNLNTQKIFNSNGHLFYYSALLGYKNKKKKVITEACVDIFKWQNLKGLEKERLMRTLIIFDLSSNSSLNNAKDSSALMGSICEHASGGMDIILDIYGDNKYSYENINAFRSLINNDNNHK